MRCPAKFAAEYLRMNFGHSDIELRKHLAATPRLFCGLTPSQATSYRRWDGFASEPCHLARAGMWQPEAGQCLSCAPSEFSNLRLAKRVGL
jgi:hypothetical protein